MTTPKHWSTRMHAWPSLIRRGAVPMALLTIGLSLAATPAAAEPSSCEGRPVTAEGSTGTAGDDVLVVSAGTASASAGAGNDLVCIRGPFHPDGSVAVDAGPGDDRVVNEAATSARVTTVLGSGADTYLGSDGSGETVVGGAASWARLGDASDVEQDTIDTRGGNDTAYSGSTTRGADNRDSIALGDGDDALHWAGEQAGTAADLGPGSNSLALYPGWQGTAVRVDAAQLVASVDGRLVLRWSGTVDFYRLIVDNLEATFVGTEAREHLTLQRGDLYPGPVVPPLHPDLRRFVDMRGGDDLVTMHHAVVGGSLVGGAGSDTLLAGECWEARVRLGRTYACLESYDPRIEYVATIDAWEDVTVPTSSRAEVVGTSGADDITARGRAVRIEGRDGDDALMVDHHGNSGPDRGTSVVSGGGGRDLIIANTGHDKLTGGSGADRLHGRGGKDVLLGGAGRDLVVGGKGADRLFGGRGRDKALGEGGRDRCDAEMTRSCERG